LRFQRIADAAVGALRAAIRGHDDQLDPDE
jgi:hypothetical protein